MATEKQSPNADDPGDQLRRRLIAQMAAYLTDRHSRATREGIARAKARRTRKGRAK